MRKYIMSIALVIGISTFTFAQKMGALTLIKADNKVIDCSYYGATSYAAPTIFDFDKDGLDDLIIGTYEGEFRFYKNTGTKNAPVYNDFTFIQANGKNAKIKNW
jgi:hypothetical protein